MRTFVKLVWTCFVVGALGIIALLAILFWPGYLATQSQIKKETNATSDSVNKAIAGNKTEADDRLKKLDERVGDLEGFAMTTKGRLTKHDEQLALHDSHIINNDKRIGETEAIAQGTAKDLAQLRTEFNALQLRVETTEKTAAAAQATANEALDKAKMVEHDLATAKTELERQGVVLQAARDEAANKFKAADRAIAQAKRAVTRLDNNVGSEIQMLVVEAKRAEVLAKAKEAETRALQGRVNQLADYQAKMYAWSGQMAQYATEARKQADSAKVEAEQPKYMPVYSCRRRW